MSELPSNCKQGRLLIPPLVILAGCEPLEDCKKLAPLALLSLICATLDPERVIVDASVASIHIEVAGLL
jgi:hypothetical protein